MKRVSRTLVADMQKLAAGEGVNIRRYPERKRPRPL
jgi:hypothetical protein